MKWPTKEQIMPAIRLAGAVGGAVAAVAGCVELLAPLFGWDQEPPEAPKPPETGGAG